MSPHINISLAWRNSP